MNPTSQLKPKHYELINLHFLGKTYDQISQIVGMSRGAIYCIINSPLAQAELAKMIAEARASVTNVPLRVKLNDQLNRSAEKSLGVAEGILDNPFADLKIKARVSQHLLDRVVFNKHDDEKEGSYRDILRKLDEMSNTMMIKPQPIVIENQASTSDVETDDASLVLRQEANAGGLLPSNGGPSSSSRLRVVSDVEE